MIPYLSSSLLLNMARDSAFDFADLINPELFGTHFDMDKMWKPDDGLMMDDG